MDRMDCPHGKWDSVLRTPMLLDGGFRVCVSLLLGLDLGIWSLRLLNVYGFSVCYMDMLELSSHLCFLYVTKLYFHGSPRQS